MMKLAAIALLMASALCSATPVSKEIRLKYLASDNLKSLIQDSQLKLPQAICIGYSAKAAMVVTISGEDADVKAAEKAIAAYDVQPKIVIIKFDFSVNGNSISKPIVRTLAGYKATISETIGESLDKFGFEVTPLKQNNGNLYLQSVITVNDLSIIVPAGVQSGDSFSYSTSKSAHFLRWTKANKKFVEYPVSETVKALGNMKVSITFETATEL